MLEFPVLSRATMIHAGRWFVALVVAGCAGTGGESGVTDGIGAVNRCGDRSCAIDLCDPSESCSGGFCLPLGPVPGRVGVVQQYKGLENASSVLTAPDGGFAVAATVSKTGFTETVITMHDAKGDMVWTQKQSGHTALIPWGMTWDANGDLLTTGSHRKKVNLDDWIKPSISWMSKDGVPGAVSVLDALDLDVGMLNAAARLGKVEVLAVGGAQKDGLYKLLTVRIAADGTIVGSEQVGFPDSGMGADVTEGTAGGVIIVGTDGTDKSGNGRLRWLDADAKVLADQAFGDTKATYATAVVSDGTGIAVVAGDMMLGERVDAAAWQMDGTLLWTHPYKHVAASAIVRLPSGNYALAGSGQVEGNSWQFVVSVIDPSGNHRARHVAKASTPLTLTAGLAPGPLDSVFVAGTHGGLEPSVFVYRMCLGDGEVGR